jgi:hypothetical protein
MVKGRTRVESSSMAIKFSAFCPLPVVDAVYKTILVPVPLSVNSSEMTA